jgi:hypothetical protein
MVSYCKSILFLLNFIAVSAAAEKETRRRAICLKKGSNWTSNYEK